MTEGAGGTDEAPAQASSEPAARLQSAPQPPRIREIAMTDIRAVLDLGWRDFVAAPMFGLFFSGFYAAAGWFLIVMFYVLTLHYYVYPMVTGFAMVAPFIAAGFYDISRKLERGEPLTWRGVYGSLWEARGRDLGWMVLVTTFAYIIWMDIAAALYVIFFGLRPLSFADMIVAILTTPRGLLFFAVGNAAGTVLAITVFSLSAVSFPLLFDRNIDFVTAMITSVKVVQANRWPMLVWCLTIAVLMFLSFATVFVGLLVVLPVLGHASWHLYRRALEPAGSSLEAETF